MKNQIKYYFKKGNFFLEYSLARAKKRIADLKTEAELPEATRNAVRQDVHKTMHMMEIQSSQIGDTRPISYCSISPNGKILATASW